MGTVVVSGIEFYGYHGVTEAERETGRRFQVDLDLEVVETASLTDDIEDTVDYGAVAGLVIELGEGPPHRTVERLARVIGERILADHAAVVEATVEVLKLTPPIPAVVGAAGIRLSVSRAK